MTMTIISIIWVPLQIVPIDALSLLGGLVILDSRYPNCDSEEAFCCCDGGYGDGGHGGSGSKFPVCSDEARARLHDFGVVANERWWQAWPEVVDPVRGREEDDQGGNQGKRSTAHVSSHGVVRVHVQVLQAHPPQLSATTNLPRCGVS